MNEKAKKKAIMFYINVLGGGGAERVVCNLANMFSNCGYPVYLVASKKINCEYPVEDSVEKFYLDDDAQMDQASFVKRNVERVRKLRKLCKTLQPDVLVSFMAEPNYRALVAAIGLKTKTIISVRNDPDKEYPGKIHRFLARNLFKLADGCVFQTEDARDWFPACVQKKSKIILNQVNDMFFREYPCSPNAQNVVAVGRLEKQKNHALLIQAFSSIANDYPNTNLVIYGEGSLRGMLEGMIRENYLEQRVYLPGAVSDVPEKVSGCRCFVLSSDYEGMPNTLLEALALGCPCVSTDCPCGGAKMVIKQGENGLLVPTNDTEELAKAIRVILDDAAFSHKISSNARVSAEQFRPDVIFKAWEEFVVQR